MQILNQAKRNLKRKLILKNLLKSFKMVFFSGEFLFVRFMYDSYRPNWGDALNIYLIEKISEKNVVFAYNHFNIFYKNVYSVIGSVLDNCDEKKLIVWGSGFIDENSNVKSNPQKVLAVRGELTRNTFIKNNINCPEVYGDPALLLPLLYKAPAKDKKYNYGFIPHYSNLNKVKNSEFYNIYGIKIINVYNKTEDFIDEMHECEVILSSSLHGLIAAESYRIPNLWIESETPLDGDDFKFLDFFSSLNLKKKMHGLEDAINSNQIEPLCENQKLMDVQSKLLKSCPFITEMKRQKFLKEIND